MFDGEGDVGGAIGQHVLDDVVDDDVGVTDRGEDGGDDAGAVGDLLEGDTGEVFFQGAAADDDVFHGFGLRDDHSAGTVGLGITDVDGDVVLFCEFDGAGLPNAGPDAGEFHHFIVGNFGDEAGIRDDAARSAVKMPSTSV